MIAERDNEKTQSRSVSLFIAVAKARVFASEGWQVVVTDDTGKTFTPADFDDLCSPDTKKSRAALERAKSRNEDPGHTADGNELEVINSPEAASTVATSADTWETLESAVSEAG
jgi:hypothetical protein